MQNGKALALSTGAAASWRLNRPSSARLHSTPPAKSPPLLAHTPRLSPLALHSNNTVATRRIDQALTSKGRVHAVQLHSASGGDGSGVEGASGEAVPEVTTHEDEELAIRLGYAEHLEAEFWGLDEDDDDDDDDIW